MIRLRLPGTRGGKSNGPKKPFPWLRLCILIFNCIFFIVLYQVVLRLFFFVPISYIYTAVAACLVIAFFMVNRGFSNKVPTRRDLPREWSREQADAFLKSVPRRRAAARVLLLFLIPLLLAILVDYLIYFLYEKEGAPFYPQNTVETTARWIRCALMKVL